jgi:hypothetical protein
MNFPEYHPGQALDPATFDHQAHYPLAIMSASREEFYGQTPEHRPLPLTVKVRQADGSYIEGNLSEDIQGHVLILGPVGTVVSPPAPREPGVPPDPADLHTVLPTENGWTLLFNGDGMLYRLDFHKTPAIATPPPDPANAELNDDTSVQHLPGKAWLTTRLMKIPAFYADQLAATEYPQLRFWDLGLTRLSPRLGFISQLNTAFLPVQFPGHTGQRLLATNDATRPYEIDPVSLRVVAPMGSNQDWSQPNLIPFGAPPIFPAVTSSAHPVFDPLTQEVFTVHTVKSIKTLLAGSQLFTADADEKASWSPYQRFVRSLLNALYCPIRWLLNALFWLLGKLGLLGKDALYLVRWTGQEPLRQPLQKWQIKLPNGKPVKINQSTHMLGITERHLLVVDTGAKIVLQDILPDGLIAQLQRWLTRLEDDLEDVGAETIAQRIQAKFLAILLWLRDITTKIQAPNTPVYVIDRQACQATVAQTAVGKIGVVTAQPVVVEGPFYHFLTDYAEGPDGTITIHAGMSYGTDAMEFIHSNDESVYGDRVTQRLQQIAGAFASGVDLNNLAMIQINPQQGTVKKYELPVQEAYEKMFFTGLYAFCDQAPTRQFEDLYWFGGGAWTEALTKFIYELYDEYPDRKLPLPQVLAAIKNQLPVNLCRLHIDRTTLSPTLSPTPGSPVSTSGPVLTIADSYTFDQAYFPNSPQFVPSAQKSAPNSGQHSSQTQGYIVCNVIHSDHYFSYPNPQEKDWSTNSELWIFDASHLSQGPLYKLSHPKLNFSLTIHSTWLRELTPAPANGYDIRSDYAALVDRTAKHYPEPIARQIYALFDQIYRYFEKA